MRLALFSVILCFWSAPLGAQEAGNEVKHKFKVERHLFARSIHIDKDGLCLPTKNTQIKAWYVQGFPAEVPPFETCTTISSKTARGEVEFKLAIVSKVNPDPDLLHRPTVRVISDPVGLPLSEPKTIDLAQADPATGAAVHQIIKTTDPQK